MPFCLLLFLVLRFESKFLIQRLEHYVTCASLRSVSFRWNSDPTYPYFLNWNGVSPNILDIALSLEFLPVVCLLAYDLYLELGVLLPILAPAHFVFICYGQRTIALFYNWMTCSVIVCLCQSYHMIRYFADAAYQNC